MLNGGANDDEGDQLSGGAGADTFVFEGSFGGDLVTDFELGVDLVDVSSFGLTFADLVIDDTSGSTVISIGDSTITLNGVVGVTEDDFIF